MQKMPMLYIDPVPLNPVAHKDLKLGAFKDFTFAEKTNSSPIVVIEFIESAKEYPIVFIKLQDGTFTPCTLNGLKDAQNLYLDNAEQWDARYIPAYVRRYPFIISEPLASGQQAVLVDLGSDRVQKKSGDALFNKDGTESAVLDSVKTFLIQHYAQAKFTTEFSAWLAKEGLLTEMSAKFELATSGENFLFEHLYVVDEKKLSELPQEKVIELFKSGWLSWIYAHLMSLSNMSQLVDRYAKKLKK